MKSLIFAALFTTLAAPALAQINNKMTYEQPGWVLPAFKQVHNATPATYLAAGWELKTVSMGAGFVFQQATVVALCEPGINPGDRERSWRCQESVRPNQ